MQAAITERNTKTTEDEIQKMRKKTKRKSDDASCIFSYNMPIIVLCLIFIFSSNLVYYILLEIFVCLRRRFVSFRHTACSLLSRPFPINRFIASRMKQSAHRLNCSSGIFLLLLLLLLISRQHFSIDHFVRAECISVAHHNVHLFISVAHRAADAPALVTNRPLCRAHDDD